MEEANKLPLKRVELSLTKFNDVAIPHHLDLLRQHKANIIKYSRGGEYSCVQREQAHARRVAARLRALLADMDALRRQVRSPDLPVFDRRTERARDLTRAAVLDYLGAIESGCRELVLAGARSAESPPVAARRARAEAEAESAAASADSVGLVGDGAEPLLQLQVEEVEEEEEERAAALRGWRALQEDVLALHDTWLHVHAAARHQAEHVARVSAAAEHAAGHVQAARAHLAAGERLRAGAWVAAGAALGALAGGPAGLALGAKAGAAAALAGSVLGGLGARLLTAPPPPEED